MLKIYVVITGLFLVFVGILLSNQFLIALWTMPKSPDLENKKNLSTSNKNLSTTPELLNLENPFIVIKKEARTLELFDGKELVKIYNIALGFQPKGDKEIEGDGKTPEGEFYIFTKNPKSKFYLSLGVSYPNIEDANRGLEAELTTSREHAEIIKAITQKRIPPQNTKLGGEIYIHGGGNFTDWTAGCIALVNKDIKEIYEAIQVKAKVRIEP